MYVLPNSMTHAEQKEGSVSGCEVGRKREKEKAKSEMKRWRDGRREQRNRGKREGREQRGSREMEGGREQRAESREQSRGREQCVVPAVSCTCLASKYASSWPCLSPQSILEIPIFTSSSAPSSDCISPRRSSAPLQVTALGVKARNGGIDRGGDEAKVEAQ